MPNTTAANVRAELARHGKSQADLADALRAAGIRTSQQTISRRLNGAIPFNVDELQAVAAWLEVPLPDLVGTAPARTG